MPTALRLSGARVGAPILATIVAIILLLFLLVIAELVIVYSVGLSKERAINRCLIGTIFGTVIVLFVTIVEFRAGVLISAYAEGVASRIRSRIGPVSIHDQLLQIGLSVGKSTTVSTNLGYPPFDKICGSARALVITEQLDGKQDDVMVSWQYPAVFILIATGSPHHIGAIGARCSIPLETNSYLMVGVR